MEYIFESSFTEDDAVSLALRNSKKIRIAVWIVGFFVVLTSIWTQHYYWSLIGVLYVGLIEFYLRYQSRRIYRSTKVNHDSRNVFSSTAVISDSSVGRAELTPEQLYKIKIGKDLVDFYVGKNQAIVIKKEQLTQGNWEDFIAMLKESWIK